MLIEMDVDCRDGSDPLSATSGLCDDVARNKHLPIDACADCLPGIGTVISRLRLIRPCGKEQRSVRAMTRPHLDPDNPSNVEGWARLWGFGDADIAPIGQRQPRQSGQASKHTPPAPCCRFG